MAAGGEIEGEDEEDMGTVQKGRLEDEVTGGEGDISERRAPVCEEDRESRERERARKDEGWEVSVRPLM